MAGVEQACSVCAWPLLWAKLVVGLHRQEDQPQEVNALLHQQQKVEGGDIAAAAMAHGEVG